MVERDRRPLNPLSRPQPTGSRPGIFGATLGAQISTDHFGLLPLALHAGPITQKPAPRIPYLRYPVAFESGTTTIMSPSNISGLYAKSVAVQEQPNADFPISFTHGSFYFTPIPRRDSVLSRFNSRSRQPPLARTRAPGRNNKDPGVSGRLNDPKSFPILE